MNSNKLAGHRLSTESLRLSHTSVQPLSGNHGTFAAGLSMRNGYFVDQHGRVQLLRGVNLGGTSKLPIDYQHVDPLPQSRAQFFDSAASVSFVNRPFPLEEADLHFARLRRWGLTFLRVIVTWEAIEHGGPGVYDHEYLQYMRALLERPPYVWSRWTGGDGAPLWTLEAVGLEPRHFEATGAAKCVETSRDGNVVDYPKMIWPTNYFKFACATMFTLFWGGKKFAPSCHVNGVQVQEFLQSHYLDAMAQLATALAGLPNIVGFGTMNEPSMGFLGAENLASAYAKMELKYGLAPTPFQGMCLADGIPQTVGSWSNGARQHVFGLPDKKVVVDPHGQRAWKQGHRCIWMDEGVWKIDAQGKPQLLLPDYFANVNFGKDLYVPFAQRYADRIRSIFPTAMLFVELPPLEFSATEFPEITETMIPRAVNATHWYDGPTLFLQTWLSWFSVDPVTKIPVFGRAAVRRLHERQLHHIRELGRVEMHNAPTLIGETGIPFNLNGARAYRTGDYSAQVEALDHTISCLEANLLSYTLWCYSSTNSHKYGDLWNLEDLSIVSNDPDHKDNNHQIRQLQPRSSPSDDAAARALLAFARPHATKIAGVPTKSMYTLQRRRYELEFASDAMKMAEHIIEPTEIHVPHCQYPMGFKVLVSGGKFEIQSHDEWDVVLFHHDEKHKTHRLALVSNDPQVEKDYKRQQLTQYALLAVCGGLAIVVIVVWAWA